jgi:hypothetical protein
MPPIQPVNNINNNVVEEKRHTDTWLIVTIILIILVAGLISLSVWLYFNYNEQKTNVDDKINVAVSAAKKTQVDLDNAKFTQQEKEPNRQFFGPADYGSVTFSYPKTWSVYVDQDGSNGGNFEAYLNPITIPPVNQQQQYALRVSIEQRDYDQVVASYNGLVKNGSLTAGSVTEGGVDGTRLDGNFNQNIRGSAVIFKIRNTTLTIRTDANTFIADFNKLIQTIKFNQ